MALRRHAVRLGIPALFVLGLAVFALWRVGPPPEAERSIGTGGAITPSPSDTPLQRVADTVLMNSVGREASLERVIIRELTTPTTFWAGALDEPPVFAVLRPDVTRARGVEIQEGSEVTLIGVVRPAPAEQDAASSWHIDRATAAAVRKIGTYLEVTEIR